MILALQRTALPVALYLAVIVFLLWSVRTGLQRKIGEALGYPEPLLRINEIGERIVATIVFVLATLILIAILTQ